MFDDDNLKNHLETEFSIKSSSSLTAEWNMNIPGNIFKLGNYRYRPNGSSFNALTNSFDKLDVGNLYTGATDADVTIESGLEADGTTPLLFTYKKEREKLYYSLEDCIKPFRPRSGINKASFFNNSYLANDNVDMYKRPRYYMPHKDDQFKYWRSYRTEGLGTTIANSNLEYGISKNNTTGVYQIDDTVPFVVYKDSIPSNRLIVKVQTNVGSIDQGPFRTASNSSLADPFFGEANKTVPQNFKVQYLDDNDSWLDAYIFTQTSIRDDGVTPIFAEDGYLSLEYGLTVPPEYQNNFILVGQTISAASLPVSNVVGYAYMVIETENTRGMLYVYNGEEYDTFIPEYSWKLGTDGVYEKTQFVTDFTNPSYFTNPNDGKEIYREFVWVKGVRLVVESMSKANVPLELIELSPRLVADLSPRLTNFQVTKVLSDLTGSSLPVGQLTASVGSLSLFDDDNSFNINNSWNRSTKTGSIIAAYMQKNVKFSFYEVVREVQVTDINNITEIVNYFVPIKTLYSEGVPQTNQTNATVQISLRDFYFYLESLTAPQILLTEVSLGQAVAILLDSIGFSNYIFKRLVDEKDPVIPFFFVAPDQNVAEVLNQLAVSTQSAMFFDEYNNFVVMTKGYLLDDTEERPIDITLYGSQNSTDSGVIENTYPEKLTNIIQISSQDQKVYNDGRINYTTRYIQRSYGRIEQSTVLDQDKTWIYKPVLLWEVSGTEVTKSLNAQKQQKYVLGAMPIKADLPALAPTVVNRQVINNIIDLGENVYYVTRFQGFFYANGEILKYDAVEHNVTGLGNVWISNNLEYQRYFAELPFNGKIYPTGLVRIYSKPFFETIEGITKLKNGAVVEHGRAQFNTPITYHNAGLNPYWSDNAYVQGCQMQSQYIFNTDPTISVPATTTGAAGVNQVLASKSQRNGILKNFFASGFSSETEASFLKTVTTGTVQSSALIFNGPDFSSTENPRNFVTYVWKQIDGAYKHYGTRLRIIGKIEAASDRTQSPVGGMTYFNAAGDDPTQPVSIGGGSAGICLVNPLTNNGYYFEIAALTTSDIESYLKFDEAGEPTISLDNILFYKVKKDSSNNDAIPIKLWGGNGNVLVDDGNFVGQYRFIGEDNPTVYDLSFEYVVKSNNLTTFYLYLNGKLIATVDDTSAEPLTNSAVSLFVRGTSKAMFENVYALSKNYADNSVFDLDTPINSIFSDSVSQINATEALSKYAMSGVVQKTYLSGINTTTTKNYNMYFEEFGTIMREAAYFNVKYDKAYPALIAQIAPTFNRLKGYTISGFQAGAYGAEFLVFNNTDTLLNLDETTGNYLRILGITFTQDTTQTLTVDDYFKKVGSFSDPELFGDAVIQSPYKVLEDYDKIKTSRILYGKNDFSLDSAYIQDQDTAEDMIGWIINKNLRPRKAVGLNIFPIPTLQLGDIVNINYKSDDGIDYVGTEDTRFVVYNIDYSKAGDGPTMSVYLSEV